MKSQIFRSVTIIGIYLHWVLKPSPTSFKSQDTLNIFRRTRGYPSVLRKVWPVYCSIQSWRFGCSWIKNSTRDTIQLPLVWLYQGKSFQDFLFKNFQSDFRLLRVKFETNHSQIRMLANTVLNSFCESSTVLHYGGKKQCKKWSDFPRKLFCVSVTVLFIWKNCTNY